MMSVLSLLWNNKVIVLVVLLALAGAFIKYQSVRIDQKDTALTAAENALDAKTKQLDDFKIRSDKAMQELTDLNNRQSARLRSAKLREREIRNVPKDQDGYVAPVMSDSLKRMRGDEK